MCTPVCFLVFVGVCVQRGAVVVVVGGEWPLRVCREVCVASRRGALPEKKCASLCEMRAQVARALCRCVRARRHKHTSAMNRPPK